MSSGPNQQLWWELEGETLASAVFGIASTANTFQAGYWANSLRYAQLYENINTMLPGTSRFLSFRYNLNFNPGSRGTVNTMTYNIVKSCVDSATAKIGKNKPRVKILTTGGDWYQQKRSQKLTKYLDGVFYDADVYTKSAQAFKDACIFGTGALKIYICPDERKIKIDRVLVPTEIIVDMDDARDGDPRSIHQCKPIARSVLKAMFPKLGAIIDAAGAIPTNYTYSEDQVLVIESWHKRGSTKAKDGAHTICVNNNVLLREPYDKDYLPFEFTRWTTRVQGLYGYGLTEELAPTQYLITKLLKMINKSQEIMCAPRVFVESGSLLNKSAFYDSGIVELKVGSTPPTFSTASGMPPEIYQYLNSLKETAYQISGISQLFAASKKEPGINSGVAQREFQDINTERFAIQGESYEQFFINIALKIIDLSRDLYEEHKELSIKSKTANGKFIESIGWSECDLDDQNMILQAFPVSKLPTTPEGRKQYVTELAQAGYISPKRAQELMEIPDLENEANLTAASDNLVFEDLTNIVEDGTYKEPRPYMDLESAQEMVQAFLCLSEQNNVEEPKMILLRDYLDAIQGYIQKAKAPPPMPPQGPQQPPQGPPQPGPVAVPQAPPRSDILPINQ